jgi:hypothetical protein
LLATAVCGFCEISDLSQDQSCSDILVEIVNRELRLGNGDEQVFLLSSHFTIYTTALYTKDSLILFVTVQFFFLILPYFYRWAHILKLNAN